MSVMSGRYAPLSDGSVPQIATRGSLSHFTNTMPMMPMEPEDEEVLRIIRSIGEFDDDLMDSEMSCQMESWASIVSFGPRCTRCGNPCGDDVYLHGTMPFHKRHFTCRNCNGPMVIPITINGDVYCQQCASFIQPKAKICHVCKAPADKNSIFAAGKCFCPNHFRCSKCNRLLSPTNFLQRAGKFYCPEHAPDKPVQVCFSCNREIDTEPITGADQIFHPECFVCSKCHADLKNKPYTLTDQKLLCESCSQQAHPEK